MYNYNWLLYKYPIFQPFFGKKSTKTRDKQLYTCGGLLIEKRKLPSDYFTVIFVIACNKTLHGEWQNVAKRNVEFALLAIHVLCHTHVMFCCMLASSDNTVIKTLAGYNSQLAINCCGYYILQILCIKNSSLVQASLVLTEHLMDPFVWREMVLSASS